MSTSITPDSSPGYFTPPLQESSSWGGKVVTKVHEVTSCVISSISSVAQSILSGCISVGTLGRYTLDDLKDYFSTKVSLEDKDTSVVSSEGDEIEKTVSGFAEDLRGAKSGLRRGGSVTSVSSNTLRIIRSPRGSSLYPPLYPSLAGMG